MNQLSTPSSTEWLNKVPAVTLFFWIIKMMSTTVGETAADYLNFNLGFGLPLTSALMGLLLIISLWVQLRTRRYIPVVYWTVVVFISVFGTLITDNLSDNLGVPLALSTGVFSVVLVAVFAVWYRQEKTLSIQAVNSLPRELFYWTAILITFALGTAAGDWVSEGLDLGYTNASLLFGGLILLTAFTHYVHKANAVTCFWVAYVLTRPLGASLGDLLSQPARHGGFGLGTIATSIVFLVVIVLLVAYLSVVERKAALQQA
jgi:uncharacterized membrane-anchored protein